jgi:pimeloyl-ACP methyl ester carboxylesterase
VTAADAGELVPVPQGAIWVRRSGPVEAPGILLLHGFASSLHSFDRLAPLLARDRHVVRVDLLGHGRSSRRSAAYDSDHQAAAVAVALDRLAVAVPTVLGHSFGADVALGVAERRPGVRRLVIVGQAPDYGAARLPWGSSVMTRRVLGPLLHRWAPAAAVRRGSRFAFAPGVRAERMFDPPGRLVGDFRLMAPAMWRTVLTDRPRGLAERPLDRRLGELGRPALVVLGAQDQLYPAELTRARYAAVPGVRVEVLPGSGHSPVLEQPEEVADLVRSFTAPDQSA